MGNWGYNHYKRGLITPIRMIGLGAPRKLVGLLGPTLHGDPTVWVGFGVSYG